MHVRIIKAIAGVLDGVSLGRFEVGMTYDIDDLVATQLIGLGWAQEAKATEPAIGPSEVEESHLVGGIQVVPLDTADNVERRRNVADRRKKPPRTDRRSPPQRS